MKYIHVELSAGLIEPDIVKRTEIEKAIATVATPEKRLEVAFKTCAVQCFGLTMTSSEAKEPLKAVLISP